jgi:hypothetical protein
MNLATLTAQSPSFVLSMHRKSASNTIITSYHGPLEFLDTQELYYEAFPFSDPTGTVAEPKKSVLDRLTSLVYRCTMGANHGLHEYCAGMVEEVTFKAIHDIGEAIRKFRMKHSLHGKQFKVQHITVYKNYIQVIYLLLEDSQKPGLTVYGHFMNAATPKIRIGILEFKTFTIPDFINILTGQDQRNCLVKLKNEAEKVFKVLHQQDECFKEARRKMVGPHQAGVNQKASSHINTMDGRKTHVKQDDHPVGSYTNHVSAAGQTIGRDRT